MAALKGEKSKMKGIFGLSIGDIEIIIINVIVIIIVIKRDKDVKKIKINRYTVIEFILASIAMALIYFLFWG